MTVRSIAGPILGVLAGISFGANAASAFDVPGVNGPSRIIAEDGSSMRLAQNGDVSVRLNDLEQQVRELRGRVEDLSFQLLEAQEALRQAAQNAGGGGTASPTAGSDNSNAGPGGQNANGSAPDNGDRALPDGFAGIDSGSFSGSGGGGGGGNASANGASGSDANSPRALYEQAYDAYLAGDFAQSEAAFRQYVQTFPDAPEQADAQYWLGESIYQQQRYADAAEVFLEGQKSNPDSDKAPEMLLKLGMSLAALDNTDTACATFDEIGRRYGEQSGDLATQISQQRAAANC